MTKILLIASGSYTLVLTVASLVKLGKISVGSFNPTDKLLHGLAYFGLVVLWKLYFVFKQENFAHYRTILLKLTGICIAFGIFIEVLQGTLTNYREPDWHDILANSIGVLIAAWLFLLFQGFLKRIKSKFNLVF